MTEMPATVRDLREFRARDLEVLLRAEEQEWLQTLRWDFRGSSDLVRQFVEANNLNGAVLVTGAGLLAGYCYYVFEDGKGLLGDVYVLPHLRNPQYESQLVNSAFDQISAIGGVPRVEGQIMMLSSPLGKPERGWPVFECLQRAFLSVHLPVSHGIDRATLASHIAIEPWKPVHQDAAAHLIPLTYRGHVDSRINDQYRTVAGGRKFLHNILQYPGCGTFHELASFSAFDRRDGKMCGMILSSVVSETSGHITQVCVLPEYQGRGLGRELLRMALMVLERGLYQTVSLTVTQDNRGARMLYERLGFRACKKFGAYVWAASL